MLTTRAKPAVPTWQPHRAAGCQGYWLAHEGSGLVVRDHARRSKDCTLVGGVAWSNGPYGPQLGGFSTTAYGQVDPPERLLFLAYPCWMAALYATTSTALAALISQGSPASNSRFTMLRTNSASVEYVTQGDAGSFTATANVGATDGLPHVAMGVSRSPSDHLLYFDGRLVATSGSNIGLLDFSQTQLTVGAWRRIAVTSPFLGSIALAAVGNGAAPDPSALAAGWLRGEFPAVRAVRARRIFAPFSTPPPPGGVGLLGPGLVGANPLISSGRVA